MCVSYLALAELWSVPHFPSANHGAAVEGVEYSIAADAPMTAAALSALDVPTLLIANEIGVDSRGRQARRWLSARDINVPETDDADVVTPWIVVVADDDHTRTWFAHLPGVSESLERADLAPIASASFVYVDCYELIEQPALRVIAAGRAAEVPMLLNLGGSELSPAVASAVRGCSELVIQTNVDDAAHAEAPEVAKSLLVRSGASWVVVTAGVFGAVAVSRSELVSVPGFPVAVRHTHCAGAAFSAGLLYGLRAGWPMHSGMLLGSASGALRCARHQSSPLPTLAELEGLAAGNASLAS
ncbi:carbohydrate kinase family protein [Nocardia cyriacigeorgica]|uniref:carbohydrate kinase family protein n=1 Tax=Nocardia cyriacigeorgica TaxID=135487 RepID=UPI002455EC77|nr:PfkB family carbohydrate kinase [Nocardia cyriacigeorgica]